MTEAIQLWYDNDLLKGRIVPSSESLSDYNINRDIALRFNGEKVTHLNRYAPFTNINAVKCISAEPEILRDQMQKFITIDRVKEVTGIQLHSQLSNAAWIHQGSPVAVIQIEGVESDLVYEVKAGEHTAEWAIYRDDVSRYISHGNAPAVYNFMTGDFETGGFIGTTSVSEFHWDQPLDIHGIRITSQNLSGAKGETASLEIRGLYIEQEDISHE